MSSIGKSKANGKAVWGEDSQMTPTIKAGKDPHLAILDCGSTPTQEMVTSPAQRLMSRRTKTLLPMT